MYNNATDDTLFLQKLLDKRGDVHFPSGIYTISNSLIIYDNTRLTLSADTVIKLADGACCTMLRNENLGKEGFNQRITVEGGIWDGNNLTQKRGKVYENKPYFMGVIMKFEDVYDLTVRDTVIKDPESYAMQFRGVDRFTVENITFDYNMAKPNMDGVHVNGPARNGYIRNIKGATNDDLVALNCDDGYDDGENPIRTKGDIENVHVDGLYADNGYTAVRLLSCGSVMRNISIKNVFGTYRFYGVSFTHHDIFPGELSRFEGVYVENVFCSKVPQTPPVDRRFIDSIDNAYGKGTHDWAVKGAPIIWFADGVTCGTVVLSNIHRFEYAETSAPTIKIDENVKIDSLCIRYAFQRFVNCEEVPLVVNDGTANIIMQ